MTNTDVLVTALLPSRGRPDSLERSVRSLLDRAAYPAGVEVVVGCDVDDPDTLRRAERLDLRVWTTHTRHGYAGLHRYFNALAEMATGRWLLLWNDDATMLTQHWDLRLVDPPKHALVLEPRAAFYPDLLTFPIVRRDVCAIVGGFSPHTCHCDTYWQVVGRTLDRSPPIDVSIRHDRADITGLHNDATFIEGRAQWQTGHFYSDATQALIAADIERLRGLV